MASGLSGEPTAAPAKPSLEELFRNIPQEKLNQPCQDGDLAILSLSITDWQAIAPFLGLTEAEEEAIKVDCTSEGRRRIAMLRKWKGNLGKKATYKKLAKLLYTARRTDVVHKLCEILEGDSSSGSGEEIPECVTPPDVPDRKQGSPGNGQKHDTITVPASNCTGGLAVLKQSPQVFGEALYQFRLCYDMCSYTSNAIFDVELQETIDQCAVDFRHMTLQTATISDQVSSVWCRTCIIFFENMSKIAGDPTKILQKISAQVRDLSEGFKGIAQWCRKLAANFHSAQMLGESKSMEYRESMKVMARQIRVLVKYLSQIEQMCEAISAFWQLESDKFSSFCPMVDVVSDFIALGLGDEVAKQQLEWLKERKTELERFHKVITAVNAAYNFPTSLSPSEFPRIMLPTLNITLQ